MENLKELNAICQKPDYKKKGNWMARNITRDMALPLSWVMLHTKITANQVTCISLFIGVLGAIAFAFSGKWFMLLGAVMIQLWYLLDHVDGHIARYRGQSSLTGVYFDYITHYIVHAVIFVGIGVGAANYSGRPVFLVMGFAAAFGVTFLNLVYDVLYKTCYFKIMKARKIDIMVSSGDNTNTASGGGFLKRSFSFLHRLCEVHVLMNIVTFIAVLSCIVKIYPWELVIAIYSIIGVFVGILKNINFIMNRTPDKFFSQSFEVVE